jgi:Tfp pilus assembly protein PilF
MSIDEYAMAERYLAGYLSVKPTFHPAHNLMGEIHERMNKPTLAMDAYKKSFSLDASQKNVVHSICKVLVQVRSPCVCVFARA